MIASYRGHMEVVHLLLERRAHVNIARNDGSTALLIANVLVISIFHLPSDQTNTPLPVVNVRLHVHGTRPPRIRAISQRDDPPPGKAMVAFSIAAEFQAVEKYLLCPMLTRQFGLAFWSHLINFQFRILITIQIYIVAPPSE